MNTSFSNKVFLITGLLFVLVLYIAKAQEEIQVSTEEKLSPFSRQDFLLPDAIPLKGPNISIFISKQNVSYEQFQIFVQETQYQTLKEKNQITPNWQSIDSMKKEDPVLWLAKEDAEAYCRWLNTKQDTSFVRLPSVEELEMLAQNQSLSLTLWEWTGQNLSDFENKYPNAESYLTSWKKDQPLKHRRAIDQCREKINPTGFRLTWENLETH